ncbi:hypothetical protein [Staphylococcus massiliensis]|uniref:Uncharacterized protein n=1 Tax=Staphylococcus massiliensis S46 TaxID=1229783 RepID=K9AZN0_9STAP|nr:hypothetical protein [Staphylococcus massiliensis]EKU48007.1 hypothetical protein C273_06093 [Staphylococcus massiliensis S46]MCG3400055.1 hypothetical protein [Staphylococcus massiliensis]MCG3412216.1 hypothetical protein [Staphylococcus massiliensis]PNZ97779.1 hypothetical protein CD133_10150 [Staphylococcus massiliensis CCUG 55927]
MKWLLFLVKQDDKYFIEQAGIGIVPDKAYDKVLPTTEQIARQPEKVYFDGERLRVKTGETLYSIEKLDELDNASIPLENKGAIDDVQIYDVD